MANDELWYTTLKAVLFTHFQARVKEIIGDGYNIYFTTEEDNMEPTKFPTVLFDELPPSEMGNTLDNTSVNAIWATYQVSVYAQNRSAVKDIMDTCVQSMKQLRFSVSSFPIYETNHDIKYGVARFRRPIGEGDAF